MKKLMIAVAIVCAVAFSHAGCYIWGFGSGEDHGSDGNYVNAGATAMLFLGTVTESAVTGGYTLNFKSATYIAKANQDSNYFFGQTEFNAGVSSDAISTTESQAYSLILFENHVSSGYSMYEGKYALVTGDSTLAADPASGIKYADMIFSDAIEQGDWKTAVAGAEPTPEPTSGMLLILGVAGLALRRKHA